MPSASSRRLLAALHVLHLLHLPLAAGLEVAPARPLTKPWLGEPDELGAPRAPALAESQQAAARTGGSGPGLGPRLLQRLRLSVNTPWFPLALGLIGFMDYFTLCGFILSPLLALGLMAAPSMARVVLLCTTASVGYLVDPAR